MTESTEIPVRFGLRHRAALGVSEKTDAVVLVISEQRGSISYIKDGTFVNFQDLEDLKQIIQADLIS